MNKRISILLGLLLVGQVGVWGQVPLSPDKHVTGNVEHSEKKNLLPAEDDKKVKEKAKPKVSSHAKSEAAAVLSKKGLEADLREAYRFERLRLLVEAKKRYQEISRRALDALESDPSAADVETYYPVAVASIFRLSLITGRNNYANMYQLVHQVQGFDEVQDRANQALVISNDLHDRYPQLVPASAYAYLMWARGLNRLAWAEKLLESIPWKNYMVYPVADISTMFEMGRKDIVSAMVYENMIVSHSDSSTSHHWWQGIQGKFHRSRQTPSHAEIEASLKKRLKNLPQNSMDTRILALCNLEVDWSSEKTDPSVVLSKRYYYQGLAVLDLFRDKKTLAALERGRYAYTMESLMSEHNRGLFEFGDHVVRLMGARPAIP